MAFRIGQKVVCVKRGPWSGGNGNEECPIYGRTYTVRDTLIEDGKPHVRLFEVVNAAQEYRDGFYECSFLATRFRAVIERSTKTGMAILREILDRESHQDRVPAKTTSGRVTDAAAQHGTEEA